MNSLLTKILLVTSLFSPLAHADIDAETRREMLSGAYEETQKFFSLFAAVDKHCSSDTAKRLVGTALVTFKTDFLGLSRFADTQVTPQCLLATQQFKAHIAKIYKENKWLLIKLVKSANVNPEFDQELACADLPVGKARYPMMNSYRVIHMRDKEYLVQFNLKYVASAGVDKSYEESTRLRVNQCLAQAGYFQDYTGNKIKLQLAPPGSPQAREITERTILLSKNIRSNSGNYNVNLGCSGIIHEMLHITGLWDEYDESPFNCRAHAQSVMASHTDYKVTRHGLIELALQVGDTGFPGSSAIEAAFDAQPNDIELTKVTSINCSNDQNRAWNFLESAPNQNVFKESNGSIIYIGKASPLSYYIPSSEVAENIPTTQKTYVTKIMKLDNKINWNCKIAVDTAAPRLLSSKLLTKSVYPIRPAHFRKIVYPSCIEKNRRYDTCTREAYSQKSAVGYKCLKDKFVACQNERFLD